MFARTLTVTVALLTSTAALAASSTGPISAEGMTPAEAHARTAEMADDLCGVDMEAELVTRGPSRAIGMGAVTVSDSYQCVSLMPEPESRQPMMSAPSVPAKGVRTLADAPRRLGALSTKPAAGSVQRPLTGPTRGGAVDLPRR